MTVSAPSVRTDQEIIDGWDAGISGTVLHAGSAVHVEHVWGTVVTLEIPGVAGREAAVRQAISACATLFTDVDRTFSTYKPLTEVTLYRNGLGRPGDESPTFAGVLDACQQMRTLTRGAFDPWAVPGGYDPSGYVKGWAAGQASDLLLDAGFADHLVNAGGDIVARGDDVPGSGAGWPVGILDPHDPQTVIEVVELHDEAMATSARYERGDHVIDPHTGMPAVSVDSATVVGPDPGVVDAVASAVLVDGTGSMQWFGDLGPEYSVMIVTSRTAHTAGPAFQAEAQDGEP